MKTGGGSDTRAQILRVALESFAARGFHATLVQEIAEQVGVTKAAVLYHFKEKIDILGALAEPLLDALDAAVAAADLLNPAEARSAMLEGLLDVWMAHRYLLRMNLQDLAMTSMPLFHRFRDGMLRANRIVAGSRPTFAARVRAAQAVAMLADPVILFADAPRDELRAQILYNVRKLFDAEELKPVRAGGVVPVRRRGRKSVLDKRMVRAATELQEAGWSADAIASELGVSRATVYRHWKR